MPSFPQRSDVQKPRGESLIPYLQLATLQQLKIIFQQCTYVTKSHACIPKDARLTCKNFYEPATCVSEDGCIWDEAAKYCKKEGMTQP